MTFKKKGLYIFSVLILALATSAILLVTNNNKKEITLEDFSKQKVSDLDRLKSQNHQIMTWGLKSLGVSRINNHVNKKEKPKIKVAILDSGISKNHEDLQGQIVKEFNAISPNEPITDDFGHGTAIAGIIAAKDNDVGIIGVSPNVEIYSVKVLDERGKGNLEALQRGIEWSIKNKVDIINVSFGMSKNNQELHRIIDKAIDSGIIVVAAAGNKLGIKADYPARYERVISVTAIDKNYNVKPLYTAKGKIDFSLPGISCVTTSKDGSYGQYNGTSLAAAYMTGIIAIILEHHDQYYLDLDNKNLPKEIFKVLKENSIDLGDKEVYGNGFVKLS